MALSAVQQVNGSYVGEHCISVKLADRDKDRGARNQPSNNLYVGNLPLDYGVEEVSEVCRAPGAAWSSLTVCVCFRYSSEGVSKGPQTCGHKR